MNIQSPNGTLSVASEIGSGAYGFVLKVSSTSHPAPTALKVVPVLTTDEPNGKDEKQQAHATTEESNSNYEKRQAEREQRFNKFSKLNPHPNVVLSHATWTTHMSKEEYLCWHKKMTNQTTSDEPTNKIETDKNSNTNVNVYFIHMEYCAVGNLEDWFLKAYHYYRLTYNLRISLYRGAVEGVNFLHSNNIIHRDLSPRNILIGFDSNNRAVAKISDFSTVISFGTRAVGKLTKTREIFTQGLGTEPYHAPESNGSKYDHSVDVYALGVIAVKLFYNIKDDPFLVDETINLQVQDKWCEDADFLKNYMDTAIKHTYVVRDDRAFLLEKAKGWFSFLKQLVSVGRSSRPTCAIILETMLPSSTDVTFGDEVSFAPTDDCVSPLYTLVIRSLSKFKEQLRKEAIKQLRCQINSIGCNVCVINIEESGTLVATGCLQCVTDVIEILQTKILLDSTLQKKWLWDEMGECIVPHLLEWRHRAFSHMTSCRCAFRPCEECVVLKRNFTDAIHSQLLRVVMPYSWRPDLMVQKEFRRQVSICAESAENAFECYRRSMSDSMFLPTLWIEYEKRLFGQQIAEHIAAYCLDYAQQCLHERCEEIVCDRKALMDAAYYESFATKNAEYTWQYIMEPLKYLKQLHDREFQKSVTQLAEAVRSEYLNPYKANSMISKFLDFLFILDLQQLLASQVLPNVLPKIEDVIKWISNVVSDQSLMTLIHRSLQKLYEDLVKIWRDNTVSWIPKIIVKHLTNIRFNLSLSSARITEIQTVLWEKSVGCAKRCPYCSAKCMLLKAHRKHKSLFHFPLAFAGWYQGDERSAILFTCSQGSLLQNVQYRHCVHSLFPPKLRNPKNHPDWSIRQLNELHGGISSEIKMAWMSLSPRFSKHWNYTVSVPINWPPECETSQLVGKENEAPVMKPVVVIPGQLSTVHLPENMCDLIETAGRNLITNLGSRKEPAECKSVWHPETSKRLTNFSIRIQWVNSRLHKVCVSWKQLYGKMQDTHPYFEPNSREKPYYKSQYAKTKKRYMKFDCGKTEKIKHKKLSGSKTKCLNARCPNVPKPRKNDTKSWDLPIPRRKLYQMLRRVKTKK